MKKIGFIGYGKMNSMLAEGFLGADILNPGQVVIATTTGKKVAPLIESYPEVRLARDNREVARVADVIIIGVRPLDVPGVLREIRDVRGRDIHIVSIAGCVRTDQLSRLHPGQITRVLPTVCSTVGEGISLCYHHPSVSPDNAAFIEELFASVSTVKLVDEELFEPAGDLMSCAPALLTQMFVEYARAGSRHSTLSTDECLEMVVATAFGTALMLQEGISPDDLIARVATPGGITEEGVKIVKQDLPGVLDRLFDTTLAKHKLVREMVEKACNENRQNS